MIAQIVIGLLGATLIAKSMPDLMRGMEQGRDTLVILTMMQILSGVILLSQAVVIHYVQKLCRSRNTE